MNKIVFLIYFITLIFGICSAAVDNNPGNIPKGGKVSFFDKEKKGDKPGDKFKLKKNDKTNLLVSVNERNDYDDSSDVITNKSKIVINWKYDDITIANTTNNEDAPVAFTNKNFSVLLLYNVTKDNETDNYYYSLKNETIASNINTETFEYKVPKLDENYVYNIVVTNEPLLVNTGRDIGISKSYVYQLYEKTPTISNDNPESGSSFNPLYLVIGVVAIIAVLLVAFILSKKMTRKENKNIDDEMYENESPNRENIMVSPSSLDVKGDPKDNHLSVDGASIFTDDTGEVSWSNLEIAKTSQQTKNTNNDNVIRTLDKKGYKRENKKANSYKDTEELKYKVVRIFNPSEDDEIKLNLGDLIEITTIFEDGWCEGINISTNQRGVFPRSCVIEEDQYQDMLNNSGRGGGNSGTLPNRRRSKHLSMNGNSSYYYKSSSKSETIPEIEIQNI